MNVWIEFQDTNVLQISTKLAEMSENRQLKLHFCNTSVLTTHGF